MAMSRPSLRWLAALLLLAAGLAWLVYRQAQGPAFPAYRIEARPLVQTVVATGRVVTPSRVQVGSEITGVVLQRKVEEGDQVQPGDLLAVLRADDLAARVREAEAALAQLRESTRPQAAAALRRAEAQLAQASREAQRRSELLQRGLIAREALELAIQAETVARAAAEQARLAARSLGPGRADEALLVERLDAARAALARAEVRSQVAGIVLTRHAEPGDLVQPGRLLFEIARSGATELLVPLDEKNLEVLALGQQAQCVADAFPGQPFPARLGFIAPSVDPQRGTIEVRLTVDPAPAFLRQDMTVSINLETGRRAAALTVPNDAFGSSQSGRPVLVRVREGKAQRVEVATGLRGLLMTEVVDGLAAGDFVLADGAAGVVDGQRLRVVEQPLPERGADAASRNELPARFD